MSQSLITWDFTLFSDGASGAVLAKSLKDLGKRWVFQAEETKEKKRHFQGRIALHKKKRLSELKKLLEDTPLEKAHLSPTSTDGSKTFNYVLKKDSRIEGPWKDSDPEPEEVPWQMKEIKELYPWQSQILLSIKAQDDPKTADARSVNILYSPEGNIGGTTLKGWLRINGLAVVVPPFLDPQDMAQMILNKPPSKAYFIDMPRNMPRSKLGGFWNGIESLKDGYCYDKRYKFRDRFQDSPCIWIKTNEFPDLKLLSPDRWKIWNVINNQLVKLESPPLPPRPSG